MPENRSRMVSSLQDRVGRDTDLSIEDTSDPDNSLKNLSVKTCFLTLNLAMISSTPCSAEKRVRPLQYLV